jgi:hypothetical protein
VDDNPVADGSQMVLDQDQRAEEMLQQEEEGEIVDNQESEASLQCYQCDKVFGAIR